MTFKILNSTSPLVLQNPSNWCMCIGFKYMENFSWYILGKRILITLQQTASVILLSSQDNSKSLRT